MSFLEALMQGIIQGLTEFLPVSSSGHLSLYQHFTGNNGEGALLFSAVLHLGTLVAVFKDIFTGKFKWKAMNPQRRAIIMMVISLAMLIPFYIFKDYFERAAEDSDIIIEGLCFLYTSVILFISDRCVKGNKRFGDITTKNAVTVGTFQGIALLPGISRSGSTISRGLFCGFERETAVQYSFILGIPAILGGCLLQVKDAVEQKALEFDFVNFAVGFIVSAIVGICAIKSDKFKVFAIYTFILGIAVIGIGIFEHSVGMNIVEYFK